MLKIIKFCYADNIASAYSVIGLFKGTVSLIFKVEYYGIIEAFAVARYRNRSCGGIDIGMTRDDLVSEYFVPDAVKNQLGFDITDKKVVLCDDILHTGRSAVAAIEAIFQLGRPRRIQLLVLIDRGGREVPVRADYVGRNVPTSRTEYVNVFLKELGAEEDSLSISKEKLC